jgi:hypothetical protein
VALRRALIWLLLGRFPPGMHQAGGISTINAPTIALELHLQLVVQMLLV